MTDGEFVGVRLTILGPELRTLEAGVRLLVGVLAGELLLLKMVMPLYSMESLLDN